MGHATKQLTWGDTQDARNYFDQSYIGQDMQDGLHMLLDRTRTTNPTYASYIRWFLDNIYPLPRTKGAVSFMYYDPSVSAVDYTAVFATRYSTQHERSTGDMGRSAWSNDATYCYFLSAAIRSTTSRATTTATVSAQRRLLTKETTAYCCEGNYWSKRKGGSYDDNEACRSVRAITTRSSVHEHGGVTILAGGALGAAKLQRSDICAGSDYFCGHGNATEAYEQLPADWPQIDVGYPPMIRRLLPRFCASPQIDVAWFHFG